MKKSIGYLVGGVEVFVDKFMGRNWINIAKWPRVIKINPQSVEKLKELLAEAVEILEQGGET